MSGHRGDGRQECDHSGACINLGSVYSSSNMFDINPTDQWERRQLMVLPGNSNILTHEAR